MELFWLFLFNVSTRLADLRRRSSTIVEERRALVEAAPERM